jgi:hypothetical protein
VRNSLISALTSCAEDTLKTQARRFLAGLSADELQFIAGYFGGCILQSAAGNAQPTGWRTANCYDDVDLKMIVLREYLKRSGLARVMGL